MTINLLEIKDEKLVKKTDRTRTLTIGGVTKKYPVYHVSLELLYNNDRNYRIADQATYFMHTGDSLKGTKSSSDGNSQYDDTIFSINENEYNNSHVEYYYKDLKVSSVDVFSYLEQLERNYMGIVLSDGRIMDGNLTFIELKRVLKSLELEEGKKSVRYLKLMRNISRDYKMQKPEGFRSAKKGEEFNVESVYFNTIILDLDVKKDQKLITEIEIEQAYSGLNKICCEECSEHDCFECRVYGRYNLLGVCVATYRDICIDKKLSFDEFYAICSRPVGYMGYNPLRCYNAGMLIYDFMKYVRLPGQFNGLTEILSLNANNTAALFLDIADIIAIMDDDTKDKWKMILFTYFILGVKTKRGRNKLTWNHPFFLESIYKTHEDEMLELSNRFKEKYMEIKNVTDHNQIVECAANNNDIKQLMDEIIEQYDEEEPLSKRDQKYVEAINNDDDISELDIPIRIYNYLRRMGITRVSQLMDMRESEIDKIKVLSPLKKLELKGIIEQLKKLK